MEIVQHCLQYLGSELEGQAEYFCLLEEAGGMYQEDDNKPRKSEHAQYIRRAQFVVEVLQVVTDGHPLNAKILATSERIGAVPETYKLVQPAPSQHRLRVHRRRGPGARRTLPTPV